MLERALPKAVPSKYTKMHIRELEYVRIERKYTKMHILWFMVYSLWFIGKVSSFAAFPRLYTIHPTLYTLHFIHHFNSQ